MAEKEIKVSKKERKYKIIKKTPFYGVSHNNANCADGTLIQSGAGGDISIGKTFNGVIVMKEQCGVGIKEFLKVKILESSTSDNYIERYIPSSCVEPYSTGQYGADGSGSGELTAEQKSKILTLTYIQGASSLAGMVAGLIYAYKTKRSFWGYVGFALLGSTVFGAVVWIATIPMKKKIVMSIENNSSEKAKASDPNNFPSGSDMTIDEAKAVAKAIEAKVRASKSSRMTAEAQAELKNEIESMTNSLKQAGYALVRKMEKDVETLDVKRKTA